MSIPISHFSPLPSFSPGNHKFVSLFSTSVIYLCFVEKFISSLFKISPLGDIIYLCFSDSLH